MTHPSFLRSARLLGLLAALAVGPAALASPPSPAPHAASVCGTPQAERWAQNAVIYGVAPTLFGDPPLASVTRRLDALKALGVNGLWISPLFRTDDPSAISYSVTDFFSIRPDYGTAQDLHTLVDEAHARGMKVLLDIVPNHTSRAHRFFQDAEKRREASPYFHFYRWDAKGKARHYFNWEHLPNLNYQNPKVRKRITQAFTYWVRTFDVDGFRVDAAWGVRQRAPDFWPVLRTALDGVKPGVFLLAEASAQDPYYVRHGFDAAYDWTTELGHGAWEKLFDNPSQTGALLGQALVSAGTPMHQVARFLENNDTGARFITRHGEATTRLAAVLLGTLPGIPVLFTGEEVGAAYQPYDDPAPLTWKDPHHLTPWFQKVIALREETPALRCGGFTPVPLEGIPGAFAYLRKAKGEAPALVVLNFGQATSLRFTLPPGLRQRPLRDLLGGEQVRLSPGPGGQVTLAAPASHAWVLVPAVRS